MAIVAIFIMGIGIHMVNGDSSGQSTSFSSSWKDRLEKEQDKRYRGRTDADTKGPRGKDWGDAYFEQEMYEEASNNYWAAVLFHTQTPMDLTYDVQEVFGKFLQCYNLQGKPVDGLAFVSMESFRRGQKEMGKSFLEQALEMDPNNAKALAVKREFVYKIQQSNAGPTAPARSSAKTGSANQAQQSNLKTQKTTNKKSDPLSGKTPEQLYEVASKHFSNKEYEKCADTFERSCQESGETLGPSCANAVYCRNMIVDWGFNGTQFDDDMERIALITEQEALLFRYDTITMQNRFLDVVETQSDGDLEGTFNDTSVRSFGWQRATSVHPHMMLGYPLDNSLLKRYVAESVAYLDEMMARAASSGVDQSSQLPPLPEGLPYPTDPEPWVQEKAQADPSSYRIRVGFVGSGFNSKAVMYLSHDMFRFFDKDRFEIHVFSFGLPDSPYFIKFGMRGVDWRKRVQSNVEHFHDLRHLVHDHVQAAQYIRDQGIHMLIEWDGYARQGERAQGLFALRPAPIQMLHQEYLGTSGALYVDYHFTDAITSPMKETEQFFTEKLIYMPNHFFSKGHAMQAEVHAPSYEYAPREEGSDRDGDDEPDYKLGTGSPQENRCLSPRHVGPSEVSFVFCNFNKLLKNNPETVRSWIRILREVPDSILCLLENPSTGTDYFSKFVHEAAGTSKKQSNSAQNPWENFVPGDGDELNSRIHFLPWEKNPFDYQRRNFDLCNIMLDSFPYNGHTVAQDALYAGVPIVTRSDGLEMSSRVSTSANVVLGLDKVLNAYGGPVQYEDMAIAIATDSSLFQTTRKSLIDTCLQRNPMHPYWDVPRYVKSFEAALDIAWKRFLRGEKPQHIVLQEPEETKRGTFDEEILAHPPVGPHLVEMEE